jgi:uncharacterized protein (TIGR01777 family)
MNILIAGGSGFLGSALTARLKRYNHRVFILTRQSPKSGQHIRWDGKGSGDWVRRLGEMDAVINLTGYGLEHWPWTQRRKRRFIDSRVVPGRALAEAFEKSARRPAIFIQASGINRYGLRGEAVADESTLPAQDYLAQLTVPWENATQPIEALGVRRIITRAAVVLARNGGQLPLMILPTRLFFGGRFGDGQNSLNWIHLDDYTGAMQFLLEHGSANGPFNLIAPDPTTGEEFMRTTARVLHRPFWFHLPKWLLRIPLGEMSVVLTEGRRAQPKRLSELGFQFEFGTLDDALKDLLRP